MKICHGYLVNMKSPLNQILEYNLIIFERKHIAHLNVLNAYDDDDDTSRFFLYAKLSVSLTDTMSVSMLFAQFSTSPISCE